MSPHGIELEGVVKRYGAFVALDAVTLAVEAGECLALIGHNGAGKTTLMKLVLGLSRPSSGRISTLGVDPAGRGADAMKRAIGFLPESVAFSEAMTGREALAFYARLKGEPVAKNLALLDRVGLAEAAGHRIKTYSKGMRQRLGLAQALIGRPTLMLLDEPTSGLDPAFRSSFYDILRELTARGATIVLSSHALIELEARTGRVAILRRGKLAALGSLAELSLAAGLDCRIRITVPPGQARSVASGFAGRATLAHVNDSAIELSCPLDGKLAMLRLIDGFGPQIRDIDIVPPSLDQVFAYFSDRGVRL